MIVVGPAAKGKEDSRGAGHFAAAEVGEAQRGHPGEVEGPRLSAEDGGHLHRQDAQREPGSQCQA